MFGRNTNRHLRLRFVFAVVAIVAVVTLVYASTFVVSYGEVFRSTDPLVRSDVARLTVARATRVVQIRSVDDVRAALREANERGVKVSIAGSRHSQGGQTYTEGAIVLDMRGFNRVIAIDAGAMTVTVESGATWDELQRALAPERLAIKVMQSSNVFTVGGSISANAHGRDIDITQMAEVVERFGLMLADGSVVEVSRDENTELFSLVIGGYGLYGVILDATLRVTRDEIYEQRARVMDYSDFPDYFRQRIQQDTSIGLMIARPSIDPDPTSFLKELVVVTWQSSIDASDAGLLESSLFELADEEHVLRDRFFFGLSREFGWAKSLRWRLQKQLEPTMAASRLVSRNNAMRPPTAPLEFLDYYSKRDSDILQEYFVPMDEFVPYLDRMRTILTQTEANLLSTTVRYVSANDTTTLPYAPRRDSFAIVLLINIGLSPGTQAETEAMTRQLVDAVLERSGTYYLTYQLYPTANQLVSAYPDAATAFERKRRYDPAELFSSLFYERYRDEVARISGRSASANWP